MSPQIDNQLYDIASYWHVPWWQSRLFYAILVLGMVSALAYGVYRYIVYRRARVCIKTAWQKALEELDRLRASEIYTQRHGKQFYFALTLLMKTYLHERFGFDVLGKTDDELMRFLATADIDSAYQEALRTIFAGSMLVRFARETAVGEQMERDLIAVYRLIEQTIPQQR